MTVGCERPLCTACHPLQKARKKPHSILIELLKSRLLAPCEAETFGGCGLAPGAQELKCGRLGRGRWACRESAEDRLAELVTGVTHDCVEHELEVGELLERCSSLCPRGAADAGRSECSCGEFGLAQQHLRGIRRHLVDLVHSQTIADSLVGDLDGVPGLWNLGPACTLGATLPRPRTDGSSDMSYEDPPGTESARRPQGPDQERRAERTIRGHAYGSSPGARERQAQDDAARREKILAQKREAERKRKARIAARDAANAKKRERYRADPEPAKERMRAWAEAHPDRVKQIKAASQRRNREERNARERARYAAEAESRRIRQREYRSQAENRDRIALQKRESERRRRAADREVYNAYERGHRRRPGRLSSHSVRQRSVRLGYARRATLATVRLR